MSRFGSGRVASGIVLLVGYLSISGIALSWPALQDASARVTRDHVVAALARPTAAPVTTAYRRFERRPVYTVVSRSAVREWRQARQEPQASAVPVRTFTTADLSDHGIPATALAAYRHAAASVTGCQIPWTLIAAIGKVESDHGQYGGSGIRSDGEVVPSIIGPALDGHGVAAIRDTDGGRWDGDKVWDHAVGPMQFIPSTWATWGRDGNGDGVADPNNIFDAALGTATYLCATGADLSDRTTMAAAIESYNHSSYYVALVMAFETGYRTGVFALPDPPPGPTKAKVRHHHTKPTATDTPTASPSVGPTRKPHPSGRPTPTSTPTDQPSQPVVTPTPPTPSDTPTDSPSTAPASGAVAPATP